MIERTISDEKIVKSDDKLFFFLTVVGLGALVFKATALGCVVTLMVSGGYILAKQIYWYK